MVTEREKIMADALFRISMILESDRADAQKLDDAFFVAEAALKDNFCDIFPTPEAHDTFEPNYLD